MYQLSTSSKASLHLNHNAKAARKHAGTKALFRMLQTKVRKCYELTSPSCHDDPSRCAAVSSCPLWSRTTLQSHWLGRETGNPFYCDLGTFRCDRSAQPARAVKGYLVFLSRLDSDSRQLPALVPENDGVSELLLVRLQGGALGIVIILLQCPGIYPSYFVLGTRGLQFNNHKHFFN